MVRPDIAIVLDTSGSMNYRVSDSKERGSDCGGDRQGTADICGDGLCSGLEHKSCASDCNLTGPTSPSASDISPAGSATACTYDDPSRMFITKRVLRSILPQLRTSANFSLCAFAQKNYFRYYQGLTSAPKKEKLVTIFLSEQEMRGLGAWNIATSNPQASFTRGGIVYTLLSASPLKTSADSLYASKADSSQESRFAFSSARLTYSDGTTTWRYLGSYYTYKQYPINVKKYVRLDAYQGPQFFDGSTYWVYNRFSYSQSPITSPDPPPGRLVVPLRPDEQQVSQDQVLRALLAHFNLTANGGLAAEGYTPTGPAIGVAHQMFVHRQQGACSDFSVDSMHSRYDIPSLADLYPSGSCPFAQQPDALAACRPRFVLVLTDGDYNRGIDAEDAAANLFNDPHFGDNPVRTLVVGLPGLPGSSKARLNLIADAGADGKVNNPSCCCSGSSCENQCAAGVSCQLAYFADNESQLVEAIWRALFEAIHGDYTTSQAGIATSGTSYMPGDMALVASTEFPGWQGHLRAWNLLQDPPTEIWDAGQALAEGTRDYATRKLYTGFPATKKKNGGPVALLDAKGAVNSKEILEVWAGIVPATPVPTQAEVEAMVEWLAGKGRSWRLDPIINSTPANVGPPPNYQVADHAEFQAAHLDRERLIYVTANSGLLHAFRAKDGSEAFAYLPPPLLPQVFALWQQGGQSADPSQFKWVLANSPRVEDVPTSSGWMTQLVLTMGPGGKVLVALDISSPSDCAADPCLLSDPPFAISDLITDTTVSSIGETWSVPALFYTASGKNVVGAAAMGSGYGSGTQGHYYNFFNTLWETTPGSLIQPGSGARVDYAVLAPTVATIDEASGRQVVATYQADLNGRILRYPQGDPDKPSAVSDMISGKSYSTSPASPSTPFYFEPAVYYRGEAKATLAAASGSLNEETPPSPAAVSTLFMRTEIEGVVQAKADYFSCPIDQICSQSGDCFAEVPDSCQSPLPSALPVSSPLLLENSLTSQMEAYYVYYEPGANACQAGNSWLIRAGSVNSSSPTLIASEKLQGVYATGVALAGGGRAVFITQSGKGSAKASVTRAAGSMAGGSAPSNSPVVESWREIK